MSFSQPGQITVTYLILFVFLSATVKQSFGHVLERAENCTIDADCTGISQFSICQLVNLTSVNPPEEAFKCVCDEKNGYYRHGNRCYHHTKFGETCDEFLSVCITKNAECLLEGGNYSNRRCRCKTGYQAIEGNGEVKCVSTITKLDDPNCRPCEANEGKCYAVTKDRLRAGCKCPSYRSGVDCENVHLGITCETSTFSMIICYQPHSDMPDNARLYVFGYDTVRQCEALMVKNNNSMCKQGQMALRLPLAPHLRETCGTTETLVQLVNRRFENKLVLQGGRQLTGGERAFAVYCSFQDVAHTKQGTMGVLALDKGSEGQYKYPQLTLRIENIFGREIPEGTAVRLGDRVMFKFLMVNDGTFSALRLEQCTASSRGTLPNIKAITCVMILNGCPDVYQVAFNEKNNFRYILGRPYQLESGLVNMFKLSEKTSFHLHCRLKACLLGYESECAPMRCSYPSFHYSAGRRRKRSSSSHARYMTISRELFWYADKQQLKEKFSLLKEDAQATTVEPTLAIQPEVVAEVKINLMPMYVVVTVILLLVTVAVVIAAGVLFFRLRNRKVSPDFIDTPDCTVPPKDVRVLSSNDERGAPPNGVCDVPLVDVCSATPNNICSVPPCNVNSVQPTDLCSVPLRDVPPKELDILQSNELIISGPGNEVVAVSPNEAYGLPPLDFYNLTSDDVHQFAPPGDYCSLPLSNTNEDAEQKERLDD